MSSSMKFHRTMGALVQSFDYSLEKAPLHVKEAHGAACAHPTRGFEAAIVGMLFALAFYVDAHKRRFDSDLADDYVLGPAWLDGLRSFRALLNGETGRFDCGALDSAAMALFRYAGFTDETAL